MNAPNRVAYDKTLSELRHANIPEGSFALFAGGSLLGTYKDYSEALAKGYESRNDGVFFIKKIISEEEVQT